VGGTHHEGWVGGGSLRNPVSPLVSNDERGSRRRGQVAKVVRGLQREELSTEGRGRKVTALDGFFAPGQRGKMGQKEPERDPQLRERGGVRYGTLERGGSGGRQNA
jgi:hypothetical protein